MNNPFGLQIDIAAAHAIPHYTNISDADRINMINVLTGLNDNDVDKNEKYNILSNVANNLNEMNFSNGHDRLKVAEIKARIEENANDPNLEHYSFRRLNTDIVNLRSILRVNEFNPDLVGAGRKKKLNKKNISRLENLLKKILKK
jgi:hypothetical protein